MGSYKLIDMAVRMEAEETPPSSLDILPERISLNILRGALEKNYYRSKELLLSDKILSLVHVYIDTCLEDGHSD